MSEYGFVEKPVLEWLAGKFDDPNDHGLGWHYRTTEEMATFDRPPTDLLVEALLLPAIMRINASVDTEEKARSVIEVFRRVLATPDLLEANRRTLEVLRDGISISLSPGADAVTVKLIEFDPERQQLNDYTVTNQYPVKGEKTCKADTVLLVNGIPVVLAEYKSFIASSHDWTEGVRQVHRYQRQCPDLLKANVFSVAADEEEFRFGTVSFNQNAGADEINRQRQHWQPWHSRYPVERLHWTKIDDEPDDDPVRTATEGLLRPSVILDFIENFTVFETSGNKTTKKLARYQQYEAANDIVDRVLAGGHQTGLIWHTQGSGKSLTMIFAAYKLRRQARLNNPTVFIVVDRTDLKTQIADDFESCDYPNVAKALGVEDLKTKLRTDRRETVITTVQSFQRMNDLAPVTRSNVIMLIDEAHRSQKGQGAGFAMTMRAKLPNAFRFGMTGTPIDRTMTNTHRDFGPVIDGEQERYLSFYGDRQAVPDGATLEVYYEPHYIPIKVDEEPLNVSFEQMCDEMEVEDEERDLLQRREARWKALVCDDRRVRQVIGHMVEHFLAHPDPNGFKAQLVTVDRRACVQYKDVLDEELRKRGLPAEWSDVIISQGQNDEPELECFHYSREETEDRITRFKQTPAEWERESRKRFGDDETKWQPPLKILIVCDKLLTGLDAPVEAVMYLDKPLRDHNLLQAIKRTNRPLPEMNKRNGLVVDYFGVFRDLQKALNYDERVREEAVIDWGKLKEQVPIEIGRAKAFFHGVKIEDTRDSLRNCLRRLADVKTAKEFEAQFKRTQTLWEAIAPDESLYPYRYEYAWLCGMYVAHRRRNRRDKDASHEDLAAKTRDLIREHTTFMDMAEEVPVFRIDKEYLVNVKQLPTPQDRAAELEAALSRELIDGEGGFLYHKLGARLKRAVEHKEASDEAALKRIRELEGIVEDLNRAKGEPHRLGLTGPGEFELFTVIREFAKDKDEKLCVGAAKAMMQALRKGNHLPAGWGDHLGGQKKVRLTLQVTSWEKEFEPLALCPVDDAEPPFLATAVEELARVIK